MPAFAAKIDPLMNRVRRLLARSAGKAMSYQMGRLSKDVKANLIKQIKTQKDTSPETKVKAVLWVESRQGRWRTAEEIEAELFESVYTLTFRERWERLADKIARAVVKTTTRTGRIEFRRQLINALKRQYKAFILFYPYKFLFSFTISAIFTNTSLF